MKPTQDELLVDFTLRRTGVLRERAHRVDLRLDRLGQVVVHSNDLELPIDVRRGAGLRLGPYEGEHRATRPVSGNEAEQAVVLERPGVVHQRVHVVDNAVDLVVEQGVGRQGARLDLRVGQQLELISRALVARALAWI